MTRIPRHVAIIMDGNRRWAKVKGLGAVAGHAFAVDTVVEQLIERAGELGIENLTMWAFSTENWGREEDEVTGIMNLFRKALMTKVGKMIQKGARLKMIGDISKFAPDIQEGMKQAMEESKKNTKITVTFALNYGGRDEIVRAVNKWAKDTLGSDPVSLRSTKQPANGGLSLAGQTPRVAERELEDYLDTAGMSDPDLIIRTGGEQRLSGFMMWQSAYSELYFTETLFPDFGPEQLDLAVEEYQSRQRRFGK